MPDINTEQVELAWMDTSTGELFTQGSTLAKRTFQEDVARIGPTEVIVPHHLSFEQHQSHPLLVALRGLDIPPTISYPHLPKQENDAGSETEASQPFSAIPLLSSYINETLLEQRPDLSHPLRVSAANSMRVDRISLRALEVKQNNDGGTSGTLLSVIDRTVTSAGSRLLADRVTSPSKSVSEINSRLALVSIMKEHKILRDELVELLKQLDDEARLLQKLSIGKPGAEDLLLMARAIRIQGQIKALLDRSIISMEATPSSLLLESDLAVLQALAGDLRNYDHLAARIEAAVDSKALEAQRTRDFAAELAASQATPEEVEQAEEEGIDIWNIPYEAISSKASKSRKLKVENLVVEPPVTKTGTSPISWGKGETSVLHPR